jgi:hypothetical protein
MIALLLLIVLLGVGLYFVETYVPMAPPFRTLLRVVVVILVLVYLWRVLGGGDLALPRIS